ncbi:MAG: acylphosphatase [Patescibacteria group bacterium]
MEDVRAHVYIEGRVQGVFYRDWARKMAESFGLVGWVRNLEDGRVEAVFEGEKETVKEMVERCKKGSLAAKVTHIDVIWEKATGESRNFQVER